MSAFWEKVKVWFTAFLEFFKSNPIPLPPPEQTPPEPSLPVPPEPPVFRTLRKGMIGDDVKKYQQKLKDLGYVLDVDGEYGNETEQVVINFQRYNGIGQTGEIGPQTSGAILAAKVENRPSGSGAMAAAALAEKDGRRSLVWSSEQSEAEKYLATVRAAIGQRSGRFSWCGAFVYWCFKQAGVAIPVAFSTGYTAAYCPGWEAWAKAKGYLLPANATPRRGDIVLFNWDGDSYADHIGIVIGYYGGSVIATAEGNTSNTVSGSQTNGNSTAIKERSLSLVRGFIRFP